MSSLGFETASHRSYKGVPPPPHPRVGEASKIDPKILNEDSRGIRPGSKGCLESMIDSQYLLLGFLELDEIICILCLNVIYGHVVCRVLNNANRRIFVFDIYKKQFINFSS